MTGKEPTHFVAPLTGGKLKPVTFSFSENTRLAILDFLNRNVDDEAANAFLVAAETELGTLSQLMSFPTQPMGDARKELAQLDKKLSELMEAIDDLYPEEKHALEQGINLSHSINSPDAASKLLGIEASVSPQIISNVDAYTNQSQLVKNGLELILDSSITGQKGWSNKDLRQYFIDRIAMHFRDCLNEMPTTTKHGPFEQILRVCLKSVGIDLSDLHPLIRAAVKTLKG